LKKSGLLIFILAAMLAFTACDSSPSSNGSDENNGDSPPVTTENPQNPSVFSFKFGDVVIEMNENMSNVIGKLGEPLGVLEAPSCAFDGTDRIFSYPGVQIYTYPVDDDDFIHTIGFFDDSVYTTEGKIRLGADIQDVIDVYGDNYKYETGMYTFTRGSTFLEFLVDDDIVIGITYRYDLNL